MKHLQRRKPVKHFCIACVAAAVFLAMPLRVSAQELPAETVAQIEQALADMQCQMDPADIDADAGGYDLDDVFCADGQYDMRMDATFAVLEKTKE
jgi:hypothetical protein